MTPNDIKNFICETVQKLGILVTEVEIKDVYGMTTYNVATPEANLLIGKDGNNLKSFNLIFNQMLTKKAGEKLHVNIDVNGYREKALRDLRSEASRIADEVRKTKKPVPLAPMSSFERMVIHSMFADDIQIETTSEGEGEERKVVISYRVI